MSPMYLLLPLENLKSAQIKKIQRIERTLICLDLSTFCVFACLLS